VLVAGRKREKGLSDFGEKDLADKGGKSLFQGEKKECAEKGGGVSFVRARVNWRRGGGGAEAPFTEGKNGVFARNPKDPALEVRNNQQKIPLKKGATSATARTGRP